MSVVDLPRRVATVRAAAAGLLLAIAVVACDASAATPTPPIVPGGSGAPREVNIIAKDYAFLPDALDLVAGETVLLHVINGGLEVHEAVIGDARGPGRLGGGRGGHGRIAPGPDPGRHASRPASPGCGSSSSPVSGSTWSGRSRRTAPPSATPWVVGCHIPGHWARGMQIPVRWVVPASRLVRASGGTL